MSGKAHATRLRTFKAQGYWVEIVFLCLADARQSEERVQLRVHQGGHDVPPEDIQRRFERCRANFETVYKPLADQWAL